MWRPANRRDVTGAGASSVRGFNRPFTRQYLAPLPVPAGGRSSPCMGAATPAAVAAEERQLEYAKRVTYKVTLTCGCKFWEHRHYAEPAPEMGRRAVCFAAHRMNGPSDDDTSPYASGVL
jgi:hypothetical protein